MRRIKVKEMKTNWYGLILPIAIVLTLAVAIWALLTIREQGSKCLADPFGYGSKQLAKAQGGDVLGTISLLKGNSATMYFSNNPNISRDYAESLRPKENYSIVKIG